MLKERSLTIAMDEETLKKHIDALSTDGSVANHFKTKLGLQLSLAPANKLLDSKIDVDEEEKETAFLDRLQQHLENFSVPEKCLRFFFPCFFVFCFCNVHFWFFLTRRTEGEHYRIFCFFGLLFNLFFFQFIHFLFMISLILFIIMSNR